MGYFDIIYADPLLPSRAKSVYMYLHDRADKTKSCWLGINIIATDLHLSRTTVKRVLTDLVKRGYLKKKTRFRLNGSHTSNLYTLR